MKRRMLALAALAIAVGMALSACGKSAEKSEAAAAENPTATDVAGGARSNVEKAGNAAPVKSAGPFTFALADASGGSRTVTYNYPMLKADGEEAQELNDEIESTFGTIVETARQGQEDDSLVSCYFMDYDFTVTQDDLASIVVYASFDDGTTQFGVYNYDLTGGTRAGNEAVLRAFGISEAEAASALRGIAASDWDESNAGYEDNGLRDKTLENLDNAQFFLSAESDGALDLMALIRSYSSFGAGEFEKLLVVARS